MATVSAGRVASATITNFKKVEAITPIVYIAPSTGIVWPRPVSKLG